MAKADWMVQVKGDRVEGQPTKYYEISVVRRSNEHGQRSYGWFDENKIHISSDTLGQTPCHPYVWEKLVYVAGRIADELNREESSSETH